jgi:putative tryptophan/tyrosine transport system substrate-binding protein
MRRREFVGLVGGVALWPAIAAAQTGRRIPVVSVLWHGTEERELASPFYHWFREGFAEAGLKIGTDVILEDVYADESDARYRELAPQMAARRPDLLVAMTAPPALALAKVHGDIPMVLVWVSDPVELGLVDSLAKRRQNVTGGASLMRDLSGKRLELLREAVPSMSRVALLVNPKTRYETERDVAEYRRVAAPLNIVVEPSEIAEFDEVPHAFARLKQAGCNGVVHSVASIFGLLRDELAVAALSARVALIGNTAPYAAAGTILAYGPVVRDGFVIAGKFVKRLLAGERAQDLPVEQPTRFEFVVNLKTARAIGIELPAALVARADKVIE